MLIGGAFYGAAIFALFGKKWLTALRTRKPTLPVAPPAVPPD
jgi:hypothetical protein